MDPITITRQKLIDALRKWDADAKTRRWPDRQDDARFADNADYLLELMAAA